MIFFFEFQAAGGLLLLTARGLLPAASIHFKKMEPKTSLAQIPDELLLKIMESLDNGIDRMNFFLSSRYVAYSKTVREGLPLTVRPLQMFDRISFAMWPSSK